MSWDDWKISIFYRGSRGISFYSSLVFSNDVPFIYDDNWLGSNSGMVVVPMKDLDSDNLECTYYSISPYSTHSCYLSDYTLTDRDGSFTRLLSMDRREAINAIKDDSEFEYKYPEYMTLLVYFENLSSTSSFIDFTVYNRVDGNDAVLDGILNTTSPVSSESSSTYNYVTCTWKIDFTKPLFTRIRIRLD